MRGLSLLLLVPVLLMCVDGVAHAENRIIIVPVVVPPPDPANFPNDLQPGRAQPDRPADPVAYKVQWDGYTSLIVIGSGNGLIRPAWVVTFDGSNVILVAYRARAFFDKEGILHVDAREAVISGPKAREWWPDSFALMPDGVVYTLDDRDQGQAGKVIEKIAPEPGGVFDRLLGLVQAMVSDSI